jgi:prepilin-type N-terminal cleavage/methylation domain-containing protein
MTRPSSPSAVLRDDSGYTLMELVVSMMVGLIVVLAAFALLEFTTNDVARVTEREHVDQTGRVTLEQIMQQLHSACVAPTITPIVEGSNATTIKFISEISPLNTSKEPVSELTTVRLHEIIYTAASGTTQGTLIERSWPSYGTAPNYQFHNTTEKATERKLLTGIQQTVNETTKESVPVFQYYRYYETGDVGAKLGQLDPTPVTSLTKEAQAEGIAKVTVSFTLAPEGKESSTFNHDRPVALEDSAILRLAPSSEASGNPNLPCTQTT